jgi:hypothetical protein
MSAQEHAAAIVAMAAAMRASDAAEARSAAWWASLAATDPAEKRRLFEASQGRDA